MKGHPKPNIEEKLGLRKVKNRKTALLLIHDQKKVNIAKNKTGKMCILGKEIGLLVWEEGKVRTE